jgi:hypothetical protein
MAAGGCGLIGARGRLEDEREREREREREERVSPRCSRTPEDAVAPSNHRRRRRRRRSARFAARSLARSLTRTPPHTQPASAYAIEEEAKQK